MQQGGGGRESTRDAAGVDGLVADKQLAARRVVVADEALGPLGEFPRAAREVVQHAAARRPLHDAAGAKQHPLHRQRRRATERPQRVLDVWIHRRCPPARMHTPFPPSAEP